MAAIKSSHTEPERRMAAVLRSAGVRYVRNDRSLPGTPDFVLPELDAAVFVHGCWWHGHSCKRGSRTPKSNRAYWVEKVERNRRRDRRVSRQLRILGYSVWTVWECQLREGRLPVRLAGFLMRGTCQ
ncbi:MAG: DNA mismatch endonuclease Vsr [Planctomycetota bacterium]|nr:MAG: DNA mismatch endonuclease Vsr [Planctomycetota bacterium]